MIFSSTESNADLASSIRPDERTIGNIPVEAMILAPSLTRPMRLPGRRPLLNAAENRNTVD
jgi:hypothetical protein